MAKNTAPRARKSSKNTVVIEAPVQGTAIVTEAVAETLTCNPIDRGFVAAMQIAEAVPEVTLAPVQVELNADEVRALEVLEVQESQAEVSDAQAEVETPPAADDAPKSFNDIRMAFGDAEVEQMVFATAVQLDDRVAFERHKNPDNENIQRTLKGARQALVTKDAARVLLAANVDPAFINRQAHDGARYNVYALGKIADLIRVAGDGAMGNAINKAVVASLYAVSKAGFTFTGELAKAAASDKVRGLDTTIRPLMTRHTVSASTAPTQASSTMQALKTLGVVFEGGSRKNPTYHLTGNPIVAQIEAKLAA